MYAGRLAGDAANTLGRPKPTLIAGTGAQSGNCGGVRVRPLGRLRRHGARSERLRVLDDRRVLRDERPQRPDADRLVPFPELHAGRERDAVRHRHRRREPDLRRDRHPREQDDHHERERRVLVHRPGRDVPDADSPTSPGYTEGSASTLAVPDGGTLDAELHAERGRARAAASRTTAQSAVPARRAVDELRPHVQPRATSSCSNAPDNRPAEHGRHDDRHGHQHRHDLGGPDVHRRPSPGSSTKVDFRSSARAARRTRTSRSRSAPRPGGAGPDRSRPRHRDDRRATTSGATGTLRRPSPRRATSRRARSTRSSFRTAASRGAAAGTSWIRVLAEHVRERPARHVGRQWLDVDCRHDATRDLQLRHVRRPPASPRRRRSSPR